MAHDHDHDHDHDHEHGSELSEMQIRVRALESILTEKGYVEPAALDAIIEAYETKIGPHNGARVVAKAWSDPAFKKALLEDATQGSRHARPRGAHRRSSGRGREHGRAPQHGRVHAVLLLPVGNARPAAGLVQGRALPLARREGPARRARRSRHHAAEGHRNPRVGLDRRDALPRAADAPEGHRRLERGAACRTRHAQLDDRHRLPKTPGAS